jgi:hypothetical protein
VRRSAADYSSAVSTSRFYYAFLEGFLLPSMQHDRPMAHKSQSWLPGGCLAPRPTGLRHEAVPFHRLGTRCGSDSPTCFISLLPNGLDPTLFSISSSVWPHVLSGLFSGLWLTFLSTSGKIMSTCLSPSVLYYNARRFRGGPISSHRLFGCDALLVTMILSLSAVHLLPSGKTPFL